MKMNGDTTHRERTDPPSIANPRVSKHGDAGSDTSRHDILWNGRVTVLTPVFGLAGVTAIYLRALQCVEMEYPWLYEVREQTEKSNPFAALLARLSLCTPDTAAAVQTSLLEQFDCQLALLVGETLARRLLAMIRARVEGTDMASTPCPDEIREQLTLSALRAEADARLARGERDRARRASEHDDLTGIANRSRMLDRLKSAIALADRTGTPTAVLFIDLDRFKQINDDQGHRTGDAMLREVAIRLQEAVRKTDTVCRYGGDEFVVILTPMERRSEAAPAAARMLLAIGKVGATGPGMPALSASIGIGLYPEDGADPDALLSRADRSMYRHKRGQRDRVPAANEDSPCVQPEVASRAQSNVPLVYGALASLTLRE